MEFNAKKIGMFALIALGLFLILAPQDTLDQYTPEVVSTMDSTMRIILGSAGLAGAYYLYTEEFKPKPRAFGSFTAPPPPNYDLSSIDSKSSF